MEAGGEEREGGGAGRGDPRELGEEQAEVGGLPGGAGGAPEEGLETLGGVVEGVEGVAAGVEFVHRWRGG